MSRIVVIGGKGFYGSRVVEALSRRGHEVSTAGRNGPVHIDLSKPGTFASLDGFDVVVNAADTLRAPPDALVTHCLEVGRVLLDLAADPATVERLLAIEVAEPKGHVIVGVGVLPGLSTILAAEAVAESKADEVTLAVRLSPLSGAGAGTIRLMAEMLGERIGPPVPILFGKKGKEASALEVLLPDKALIARTTGVGTVTTRMALNPSAFGPMFRFSSAIIRALGPLGVVLMLPMRWMLGFLRGVVLRDRPSVVELTAISGDVRKNQTFEDGQAAVGLGVVTVVMAWESRDTPPPPGILTAADV